MHRLATAAATLLATIGLAIVTGCAPREEVAPESQTAAAPGTAPPAGAAPAGGAPGSPGSRNAYFGDLHIHTRYSFDAFIFNVRVTPDDAYRFARGEAIDHPAGFPLELTTGPLDFAAVTDHAEYLGALSELNDPQSRLYPLEISKQLRGETGMSIREAFQSVVPSVRDGKPIPELADAEVLRSVWAEIVASAERHNQPGVFTTFAAYEFTSPPDSQNLHRNVIFKSSSVPAAPFSALDSLNPEDLWTWLDARRAEGIEALAIPHNSNGSNGQMFKLTDWAGDPLDAAYADLRMRNEPLVEVTQVKGTSETHPMLSPNDEWAGFETFPFRIATTIPSDVPGSYAREALVHGLELEEKGSGNPFRFGLIGSSDTHVGAGAYEESNYWSKVGALDGTAQQRGSVPLDAGAVSTTPSASTAPGTAPGEGGERYADTYYNLWGASGLAGVWAEENTRASIYDALRRKETFATSGPRIKVRFFAGFGLPDGLADDPEAVVKAYQGGVPMGGDLVASRAAGAGTAGAAGPESPRFLVWAMRDARSAALQRLQVVKGWVEEGAGREQVYDVACSDGLAPDPATRRCPDNGATVDLATCAWSEEKGAGELRTLWTDPDFDPSQRAFYYVRVLENPTCRWSTWDALRAGVKPNPKLPPTIQERAWSSPIWYAPAGGE